MKAWGREKSASSEFRRARSSRLLVGHVGLSPSHALSSLLGILGRRFPALSSGPVRDRAGKLVGTFTSIWRLVNGRWRIVFDKGNEACPKAP